MKNPLHLTPAEFEIIEHLWASPDRLSVAEVLERIQHSRDVAYTTIMTLMDKMARKGSVRRVKQGKAYLYAPAVRRDQVQAYLLRDFADRYFGGDLRRIAACVDGENRPSARARRRPASRPQTTASSPQAEETELDVALL